jgi:hypothetical protein
MKVIKLKSKDATFELHVYRAGESVTIFPGTTGTFGKSAGSKTAGIVYVTNGLNGTRAEGVDVDDPQVWNWIQKWMQIGMDAQ